MAERVQQRELEAQQVKTHTKATSKKVALKAFRIV